MTQLPAIWNRTMRPEEVRAVQRDRESGMTIADLCSKYSKTQRDIECALRDPEKYEKERKKVYWADKKERVRYKYISKKLPTSTLRKVSEDLRMTYNDVRHRARNLGLRG